MNNESGTYIAVVVLVCFVALLLLIKAIQFFVRFFADVHYTRFELKRANDDEEYRYWRRKLRCRILCLIPFVNEKNVKGLYSIIFHRPKHAEEDDGKGEIFRLLAPSLAGAVICAVALSGMSWAWFTASRTQEVSVIETARYTVSAEMSGEVVITADSDGVYSINTPIQKSTTSYTVTIKANGTAINGYCKIIVGDTEYYTPQIKNSDSDPFSFALKANSDVRVFKIIPQWGECTKPPMGCFIEYTTAP